MADLVVVMGEGRIRQAAPPVDIYRRPADAFVADFIGSTNLLPAETDSAGRVLVLGRPVPGLTVPDGLAAGVVSVRPEDVRLEPPGAERLTGTVTFVRDLGGTVETFVAIGDTSLVAVAMPRDRRDLAAGDAVGIALSAEACVVLAR